MIAGGRFEPTTFGVCDLTQLSLRVGLYLQSFRLPRSSEARFGIAVPAQRALGSTDFDR
jgi:hypothetical protein